MTGSLKIGTDHRSRVPCRAVVTILIAMFHVDCGKPEPPPNVLIYVVDTLRADSLGYENMIAQTPHFDRLAAESVVFTEARAHSSWTRPSVASILTGNYPAIHGVYDRSSRLRDDAETLPERLRKAGYTTGYITTNPNVGTFFGFDQGFDEVIQMYDRRVAGTVHERELIARSAAVTDRAIEWIAKASHPFLLVVLTVDPHNPYQPPPELQTRALRRLDAVSPPDPAASKRARRRREFERGRLSAYMAEVTVNDQAFGRLADFLRTKANLDNTLVVVTSDHGEEFWEHGRQLHGRTLYDEVLRVPLLIRFPSGLGPPPGTRVESPTGSVDIAPTVLQALGLPVPDQIAGHSLIEGAENAARAGYASLFLQDLDLHTLTIPPWKLHLDRKTGEERLFDLTKDPYERSPIDTTTNADAREALRMLRPQLAELVREHSDRSSAEPSSSNLPDDVRATLKALGYLDDEPN